LPDAGAVEAKKKLVTRAGVLYHSGDIEDDMLYLLRYYNNRGFPFCRIQPDPVWNSTGSIEMNVRVEKGKRMKMGTVRGKGNDITRDYVIQRLSGIDGGSYFHREKIERISYRLMKSGFFESVDDPVFVTGDSTDLIDLEIPVKEARCNTINGVLGYLPPSGTGRKGVSTGLFELSFRNLFGTARDVYVKWRRKERDVYELLASYTEPWLLGSDFTVSGTFYQTFQDSTYGRNRLTLGIANDLNERISARCELSKETVTPGNRRPALVPSSRSYGGEVSLLWDRADHPLNPRQGFRISLAVSGALRVNTFPASIDSSLRAGMKTRVMRAAFNPSLELFHPMTGRQVIALSAQVHALATQEEIPPLFELFTLGGAESLRGYREEQFRGTVVGLVTLEYRFLTGRYARIFPFIDGGYYYRPQFDADGHRIVTSGMPVGYGVGIRVQSGGNMIGLDYGLGKGDGIKEGKVHVRIENRF
jgi:outer membrane protein insertion porin family